MTTKYDNANWFRCARTGGATTAVIVAGGNGQGNAGVSLPCRGCWVQTRSDSGGVWLASPPFDGIGPFIPGVSEGSQPMWIPISDVAQLFFSGFAGEIVDIVYLLG